MALPKKRKPYRKLEQKTKPELIKEADTWFSRYVRLRDSVYRDGAWVGTCITCPRKMTTVDANGRWYAGANLGHYVSRGRMALRFDEENCNLQCAHCNAWRDKVSMLDAYKKALDMKYGAGTARRLKRVGRGTKSFTKSELLEIIQDSKTQIDWYLTHP